MDTPVLPPPPKLERRDPAFMAQLLKELKELHKEILDRRGGVPVDVDDILDEMRGRTDRNPR